MLAAFGCCGDFFSGFVFFGVVFWCVSLLLLCLGFFKNLFGLVGFGGFFLLFWFVFFCGFDFVLFRFVFSKYSM